MTSLADLQCKHQWNTADKIKAPWKETLVGTSAERRPKTENGEDMYKSPVANQFPPKMQGWEFEACRTLRVCITATDT